MKKGYFLLVLVLIFSLTLISCGSDKPGTTTPKQTTPAGTTTAPVTEPVETTAPSTTPAASAPKRGGVLRYIYGYSPGNNIGWPMETNIQNSWGTNFVFAEPLVAYMLDNSVKPWLATSWEFAPDYSSITFKLREGVRFHDGEPFNAEAVKWQLDMNIELGNSVALNWKSVDVIDEYTVRINFTTYENSFWANITNVMCFFISPKSYKENGIDWTREHPIGTGPFKFVSWERDVNMVFERNDDYWQEGKPYLDGIEFITVKDKMTEQSVMVAGEGDILALQSGRELFDLEKQGFEIAAYAAGTDFLVPDTVNPGSIFSDIRIRMAMDHAINKEAVTKALGYGYMVPNHQLPAPQQPFFNPNIKGREYSIEKAKSLLAEAGYPNGINTKLYVEGANYGTKALAIQAQLANAGINAEIVTLENLKFWEYVFNGWSDGILFAGFSWSPNFARSYQQYFPPDGNMFVSVKVPDVTEIVKRATTTPDPDEQREANYELVQAIFDDCTVVPYLSDAMGWVIAPYVKDHHLVLEGADFNSWFPADIWLDK